MQRIAIVGLLLPHRGRTDLGRVPDPQLVVIFLEQSFKPLSVHRGFHPDASRTWKRRVKRPCLIVPMFQSTLGDLSCFGIDHCNLLKPRVKITTDNYHRSAPFIRALVESQSPSLLGPEGADDLIQSTSTVLEVGLGARTRSSTPTTRPTLPELSAARTPINLQWNRHAQQGQRSHKRPRRPLP